MRLPIVKPQIYLSAKALIVRLIGRIIVLYRRSTVPEISHQFLGRSKISEIVKVHDAVVHLHVRYPVSTKSRSSVQIHDTDFISRLIGNVLRMKTPLKYGTRIRLTSSFNCTLVVAAFLSLWRFFFLCCYPVRI